MYMVEVFTKRGIDPQKIRGHILKKTDMVPAIYDYDIVNSLNDYDISIKQSSHHEPGYHL